MKKKVSQYFNIYFVTTCIGCASLFYMLSFVCVCDDIGNSSSRAMKQKYCKENPGVCPKNQILSIKNS